MKSAILSSILVVTMFAVINCAQADNKKQLEKSKQTIDNITNANTVKGSTTTSSGNNSEKAKPGDSASDFRPPQKPLKIKEPPPPKK